MSANVPAIAKLTPTADFHPQETVGSTDEFCLSQFLRFHGLSFMKKYLDETEETPIQTLVRVQPRAL